MSIFELLRAVSSYRNGSYSVELHRVEGRLSFEVGEIEFDGHDDGFSSCCEVRPAGLWEHLSETHCKEVPTIRWENCPVTPWNSGTVQCGHPVNIRGIDLIGKAKMEEIFASGWDLF